MILTFDTVCKAITLINLQIYLMVKLKNNTGLSADFLFDQKGQS